MSTNRDGRWAVHSVIDVRRTEANRRKLEVLIKWAGEQPVSREPWPDSWHPLMACTPDVRREARDMERERRRQQVAEAQRRARLAVMPLQRRRSPRLTEVDVATQKATDADAAAHTTRPVVVQAVPLLAIAVVAAQPASEEAARGLPVGRVLYGVQQVRAVQEDGQSGEGDVAGRRTAR